MVKKVTIQDIAVRLGVTENKIYRAIYSGVLPNPDEYNEWDLILIEPFLHHWESRISQDKSRNGKK